MKFEKPVFISLCDKTGNMVKPWITSGCHGVLVDPQHPKGIWTANNLTTIGATILECSKVLGEIIKNNKIVMVFGFPPCTDVAVSGSRWFPDKEKVDKQFQAKAALVAEQCRMIGLLSGAKWGFENPVSVFSSIFGKPNYKFDPYEFTGYCPDDNYYKKTCLWTSSDFKMPRSKIDHSLGFPDERIHRAAPSEERANFRSATPMGFARAVFHANFDPTCVAWN